MKHRRFLRFLDRLSVRPLLISALLVSDFCLTGCWEGDPEPTPGSKQVQELSKDLYTTRSPPKPEQDLTPKTPEEDFGLDRFDFPDQSPLLREQQARIMRGQRQWQAWQQQRLNQRRSNSGAIYGYRGTDPDYQQWEPIPVDRSTLPVDRSRILTADMRISAVLEDSVNSQVPGRVMAVVDRDVLSPNGKYILLPAYTRIICKYESINKVGKSRLPVMCKRAIRPDGVSIMLTEATAVDQMGRSGLVGEVDNRMWQKYGAAFTMASISALSQMAGNSSHREGINNSANAFSQNLGQVTARVLDEYLDLTPVITIAAGSRIQIIPEHDIYMRKPIPVIAVSVPNGRQQPMGPTGNALPPGISSRTNQPSGNHVASPPYSAGTQFGVTHGTK